MKSRFSSIVQIKERRLKDVEASLVRARGDLVRAQEEVKSVSKEIDGMKSPKGGSFSLLQISNMAMASLYNSKKQKQLVVDMCENRVQELLGEYKSAHMDFEKMKHLHDVEIAKQIKKIKELEQKELDEMSVALFNLDKKEDSL